MGDVLCAAVAPPRDERVEPALVAERRSRMGFFVTPQTYSNIAKRNVLVGVLPLQNSARKFDGVMVVTLDVQWLDLMLRGKQLMPRRDRRRFRFGRNACRLQRP